MKFFQKLFVQKRPKLIKNDITNQEKVFTFLAWFIENDQNVKVITNRSCNLIFNEGFRPRLIHEFSSKEIDSDCNNVIEWFLFKMYFDLNYLKDSNENEFRAYLKVLDENWKQSLITSGDIAIKYNVKFSNFDYERELLKIPVGPEQRDFKIFLFEENVFGAEIRILTWLFHEYFGIWYKSEL